MTKALPVEVERVVGFGDTLEVEPSRIYWPFELSGEEEKKPEYPLGLPVPSYHS